MWFYICVSDGVCLSVCVIVLQGTQIYDAKRGAFVDLGILDVMQIFGRAGRPQFDKFGEGTIITTHDKLSHYLTLLTQQNPIESQYLSSLADNLNAEVCLMSMRWFSTSAWSGAERAAPLNFFCVCVCVRLCVT